MTTRKHTAVKVTNPRATTPGRTTTTETPFAPLPGPEPVTPVAASKSHRLAEAPHVRHVGKVNPHVPDSPEG